jgi:transposase
MAVPGCATRSLGQQWCPDCNQPALRIGKTVVLVEALTGFFTDHHAVLLAMMLDNIDRLTTQIGFDMTRFPTAAHLVSWAKFAPAVHESAGTRQDEQLRLPWTRRRQWTGQRPARKGPARARGERWDATEGGQTAV